MIKYKLTCKKCNNSFDSWFPSSKEYEKLKSLKHINCPNCNSLKITKDLMSPNVLNSKKEKSEIIKNEKYVKIKNKIKEYQKFIKPEDLIKISKANNLKLEKLDGMKFNLLTEQWSLSPDNSVNYIAKFKKN